jgi:hypothetical protein
LQIAPDTENPPPLHIKTSGVRFYIKETVAEMNCKRESDKD